MDARSVAISWVSAADTHRKSQSLHGFSPKHLFNPGGGPTPDKPIAIARLGPDKGVDLYADCCVFITTGA
jgi:hypothetical protein